MGLAPGAPTVPIRSRRSSPAQNTGPFARITATRSSATGCALNAACSPSSISPSSAFRFSGRFSVTVFTGPFAVTSITDIACLPFLRLHDRDAHDHAHRLDLCKLRRRLPQQFAEHVVVRLG